MKITREIIRLTGEKDSYIYEPRDKQSVLKVKGELCRSFIGYRESSGTKVLIKKLHPRLMNSKNSITRFVKESSFVFDHPAIAGIDDIVVSENGISLVREYIDGIDMKSINDSKWSKKVSDRFLVQSIIRLLDALEFVHRKGVIHCDLKPSNIIIHYNQKGEPDFDNPDIKLIDFGLAQLSGAIAQDKNQKLPFSFIYAPPEQVLNKWNLINPTVDIYSMGITLYELIGKRTPFWSENPMMIMQLQIAQSLQPVPQIPDQLMEIIRKASARARLQKPPWTYPKAELDRMLTEAQQERYQTAGQLKEALSKTLSSKPTLKITHQPDGTDHSGQNQFPGT